MASEEQHAEAVKAALTALSAVPKDYDELDPAALPAYYNEVTVERRFGGTLRGSNESPTEAYRITARSVAKTVSNAREMRRRAMQLEGTVLTIDGAETTPVEFESADPIGPDDGWYSGLLTLTYTR